MQDLGDGQFFRPVPERRNSTQKRSLKQLPPFSSFDEGGTSDSNVDSTPVSGQSPVANDKKTNKPCLFQTCRNRAFVLSVALNLISWLLEYTCPFQGAVNLLRVLSIVSCKLMSASRGGCVAIYLVQTYIGLLVRLLDTAQGGRLFYEILTISLLTYQLLDVIIVQPAQEADQQSLTSEIVKHLQESTRFRQIGQYVCQIRIDEREQFTIRDSFAQDVQPCEDLQRVALKNPDMLISKDSEACSLKKVLLNQLKLGVTTVCSTEYRQESRDQSQQESNEQRPALHWMVESALLDLKSRVFLVGIKRAPVSSNSIRALPSKQRVERKQDGSEVCFTSNNGDTGAEHTHLLNSESELRTPMIPFTSIDSVEIAQPLLQSQSLVRRARSQIMIRSQEVETPSAKSDRESFQRSAVPWLQSNPTHHSMQVELIQTPPQFSHSSQKSGSAPPLRDFRLPSPRQSGVDLRKYMNDDSVIVQKRHSSLTLDEGTPSVSDNCSNVDFEKKQLLQKIEEAEARIEQNKIFTYMVIHDLKHPTESLINSLDLVKTQIKAIYEAQTQISRRCGKQKRKISSLNRNPSLAIDENSIKPRSNVTASKQLSESQQSLQQPATVKVFRGGTFNRISNLVQDEDQKATPQPEPAQQPAKEEAELKCEESDEEVKHQAAEPLEDPPLRQVMPVNNKRRSKEQSLAADTAIYNQYLSHCVASLLDFLRTDNNNMAERLHLFNNIIHKRWAINFQLKFSERAAKDQGFPQRLGGDCEDPALDSEDMSSADERPEQVVQPAAEEQKQEPDVEVKPEEHGDQLALKKHQSVQSDESMSAGSPSDEEQIKSDKDAKEFVGSAHYSSRALQAIPNKLIELPFRLQEESKEAGPPAEVNDTDQQDLIMPLTPDLASLQSAKASPLLDELTQGINSLRDEMKINELNLLSALEFIETLTHTSHMMRNLMMDLLDLAQMEKNTFRVNQNFFSIIDCVNSAFEVVRHVANKRQISLVSPAVSTADLPYLEAVNGDRDRVMQVIINFLSNSIKFSHENSKICVDLKLLEFHAPNMQELINQQNDLAHSVHSEVRHATPEDSQSMPSLESRKATSKSEEFSERTPSGSVRSSRGESDYHTSYIKYKLSIQDFGMGIPPDKLNTLFIDFGNLEQHRKHNPQGRGLGLSICKSIVEQMGGTVDVESALNRGSIFSMTFKTSCKVKKSVILADPTAKSHSLAQGQVMRQSANEGMNNSLRKSNMASVTESSSSSVPSQASKSRKVSIEPDRRHLPRLLLVNDQSFILFGIKLQLESRFQVTCAENGLQAAQMVEAHPHNYFSVVLLDINMPIMDGFECCRRMSLHVYASALQQPNDSVFGNMINVPIKEKSELKSSVSMFVMPQSDKLINSSQKSQGSHQVEGLSFFRSVGIKGDPSASVERVEYRTDGESSIFEGSQFSSQHSGAVQSDSVVKRSHSGSQIPDMRSRDASAKEEDALQSNKQSQPDNGEEGDSNSECMTILVALTGEEDPRTILKISKYPFCGMYNLINSAEVEELDQIVKSRAFVSPGLGQWDPKKQNVQKQSDGSLADVNQLEVPAAQSQKQESQPSQASEHRRSQNSLTTADQARLTQQMINAIRNRTSNRLNAMPFECKDWQRLLLVNKPPSKKRPGSKANSYIDLPRSNPQGKRERRISVRKQQMDIIEERKSVSNSSSNQSNDKGSHAKAKSE